MIHGDLKDRDILKRYIESLIGAINAIEQPHDAQPLPIPIIEQTYLDLIRRIKASLMGILAQLNYWPEHGEMKVPITLLFRSCVTDVLLLLYLKTLEEHEATFENEVKLLDKPYIRFVESLIATGQLTGNDEDKAAALQAWYADEKVAPLIKLTEPQMEFLNNAALRATSDLDLLKLEERELKSSLTTDSQYKHLAEHDDLKSLSDLYWLYKHGSQHEHYSRLGSRFFHLPQWFECLQWYKVLVGCFEAVRLVGETLSASEVLLEDLRLNVGHLYQRLLEHQEDQAAAAQQ
ncbi:hypothetical protein H8B15_15940 [Hymenobacter sp. BT507]|uniref:Uncharacterized protein n=1 Tax=Hymenobacter citatus TaxID=2763506 RepID=A0ABR7MNX6_9BACT|nr:hypothetical protein [Hymenobacter citatus]MBC6612415.1 hypothetical protein [Hymenobacter citatus]